MKKILIVEDEKTLREALTKKLNLEGFITDTAADGMEALQKRDLENYDLILLDIVMPVLDGIATLKKLKESEKTKNIPVVILTNLSDGDKVSDVLKNGGTDYLVKADYSLESLVKLIKERLKINE